MEARRSSVASSSSSASGTRVLLDWLLSYFLFAPLMLIFWNGTDAIFDQLVLSGVKNPLPRVAVVMIASGSIEVLAALSKDHLAQFSEVLGNTEYFLFSRLYNYVMAMADVSLFLSTQTFYTEFVGPGAGAAVHARWAATVLVVSVALGISRSLISSPFVVSLDDALDDEWFDFSLYFKTPPSSPFVHRLFDSIFSVFIVSFVMDTYYFTLTFTFDGLIYPSDFTKAMIASCAAGYAIIFLLHQLAPLASEASAKLERDGRTAEKLVVEVLFTSAAIFGVILLAKGLTMFAQTLSVSLGDVCGVSAHTMAIVNHVLAFFAMSALGVSSLIVFKGPSIDGELTNGQGLHFPTDYLTTQPQTRRL